MPKLTLNPTEYFTDSPAIWKSLEKNVYQFQIISQSGGIKVSINDESNHKTMISATLGKEDIVHLINFLKTTLKQTEG